MEGEVKRYIKNIYNIVLDSNGNLTPKTPISSV